MYIPVNVRCNPRSDTFRRLQEEFPAGNEQATFKLGIGFQVGPLVRFDKLNVGGSLDNHAVLGSLQAEFPFQHEQGNCVLGVDGTLPEDLFALYMKKAHQFVVNHSFLFSPFGRQWLKPFGKSIFSHLIVWLYCICASKVRT